MERFDFQPTLMGELLELRSMRADDFDTQPRGSMRLIRFAMSLLIAALSFACASESTAPPPVGFTHAAAFNDCSPTKGPGVAIYLTPDPLELAQSGPYVILRFWHSLDEMRGRVWSLGTDSPDGQALYVSTAGTYEPATSGHTYVKSVSADKTIEGSMDVQFPNGGRIHGGFKAVWNDDPVYCG
jgi:hypothetical protein